MHRNNVSQQRTRFPGPLRVALLMSTVGIVNAAIAATITYYLNSHQPTSLGALQSWSRSTAVLLLWPSGIMMMATESSGPVGIAVILATSVIANGFVYGLVGLGLGAAWYKVRGLFVE